MNPTELGVLFANEVRTHHNDHRRQAVMAILSRRGFPPGMTVLEFIDGLRGTKDMWEVVTRMDLVAFCACVSNVSALQGEIQQLLAENNVLRGERDRGQARRRTRLTIVQKDRLKEIVSGLLAAQKDGLSRAELAAQISDPTLRELGLPRRGVATKLRVPLSELLHDQAIGTRGEKRLLKYVHGSTERRGGQAPSE